MQGSFAPDGSYPYLSVCMTGPNGEGNCFEVNYPDIREGFEMQSAGDVVVTLSWSGWEDIQFDYRFRVVRAGETPDAPQDDCGLGRGASNWYATASRLATPVDCVGVLAGEDAWDWYTFDALLGQQIDVTLDVGTWVDHEFCLYDPWGSLVDCGTRPTGKDEAVSTTAGMRGAFLLVVYRFSGDGAYGLRVNVTGEPANEAPSAFVSCPWLAEVDRPFRCTARGEDFESSTLSLALRWGRHQPFEDLGSVANAEPVVIERAFTTLGSQLVTLRVEDEGGLVAHASFRVWIHAPAPDHDDCGSGADAGDHAYEATPRAAPVAWCAGKLHGQDRSDTEDHYAIEVPEGGGRIRASLQTDADLRICVADASGWDVSCGWRTVEVPASEGTWTIVVRGWENASYAISATTRELVAHGDATLPSVGGPVALSDLPAAPALDGYFVDLPFVGSGIEGLRVSGEPSYYRVRFYDADGAYLGGGSGFTGDDFWSPTPVPEGATRVLVQRGQDVWFPTTATSLTLHVYW